MIKKLLVANRAEIASRVFRTCRDLGIGTVAVHSDADALLPYVREADVAVRLPGDSPADTYLQARLVVDAARRSGADAVHPGYGFLSESAEFAQAVLDAGLTWVGPTPRSIEQMGSKVEAKRLMEAAGVPVLATPEEPTESDLPLIVKASAGGGGRGMRIVRDLAALPQEIAAAESEAAAAFGDGTVFVEPYVERGRHVEVQVVGDEFGHVDVFGERDCSLQRRHQKVVEETPAPGLPEATRSALHEAARSAAMAVDYVGAGTVEFLYDPAADRFYFLEMNTRLQVEHPVTEEVHGVDLVRLQLGVAEHEKLPALWDPATPPSGHAIEVRLYAEDPADDYRPQSGVLTAFEIPDAANVRVDAGYTTGSEVSTFYDAMLAKVVAWAPTRADAARRLAGVLSRARIHGVPTNRDLLVRVLRDEAFVDGRVSTAFLDEIGPSDAPVDPQPYAVAAALAIAERDRGARTVQHGIPVAWRNVPSQPQRTEFDRAAAEWRGGRDGYLVDGYLVVAATPEVVTLERDGVRTSYEVAAGETGLYDVDGPAGHVRLVRVPRFVDPAEVTAPGSLLAPMPGTVVAVPVDDGAEVVSGQPLLVLEAMKMQHTISAPGDGVVELAVDVGRQVASGDVLAVVTADPESPTTEGES